MGNGNKKLYRSTIKPMIAPSTPKPDYTPPPTKLTKCMNKMKRLNLSDLDDLTVDIYNCCVDFSYDYDKSKSDLVCVLEKVIKMFK